MSRGSHKIHTLDNAGPLLFQASHLLLLDRQVDFLTVAFGGILMDTHALHRILSDYLARGKKTVTTKEEIESLHECPNTTVPPRRQPRLEERRILWHACYYEMIKGLGEDSIITYRGRAFALNISSEGILLLMDQVPQVQQLLEIHTPSSKRSHILTLFEVCWTREIQVGVHDCKYLAGCRLTFGPSATLLFERKDVEHSVAHPLS